MTTYRVVAPYVLAETDDDGPELRPFRIAGRLGLTEGAVLPASVTQESIDHLLRKGMIEPVPE